MLQSLTSAITCRHCMLLYHTFVFSLLHQADPGLASRLFHRLSTLEKRVDMEQTQVKAQVQLSISLSINESVPSTLRTPTDTDGKHITQYYQRFYLSALVILWLLTVYT